MPAGIGFISMFTGTEMWRPSLRQVQILALHICNSRRLSTFHIFIKFKVSGLTFKTPLPGPSHFPSWLPHLSHLPQPSVSVWTPHWLMQPSMCKHHPPSLERWIYTCPSANLFNKHWQHSLTGTVLKHFTSDFILTAPLRGRYYHYPHFKDDEVEVQRRDLAWNPRSHNQAAKGQSSNLVVQLQNLYS